ncbi:TPA: helix-turn-helix domain-containing protein [Streptococcus suis]|uniref:helix-turn-helix domain-containing protein n=1 Tax=Streptococcus suis TaxID=1307 RepID=UPI002AA31F7C|nr:helix-turn-helix domain-containing protein [Streptococcus suis]HEM3568360.1 helix-turn-helix domain-containing protein [Streptococcus suis]HEM3977462.1 helix-turn-helix domain-containing protein [Streptococcus suis]
MFAERLKQLRKEAGLTQKSIADHFNIKQPTYSQWEQGKRGPSDETLQRFASFFNVSTDYLLGNSDIRNPEEEIDLDDFELLYRNTSKGLSAEEKNQLASDLKNFLLERQRLINERELAKRD